MLRLTSSTATRLPNSFVRFVVCKIGSVMLFHLCFLDAGSVVRTVTDGRFEHRMVGHGLRKRHETARHEDDEEDEQHADDELPLVDVRREDVLRGDEDASANHRAVERPHTAEDGHHDDLTGVYPVEERRRDVAVVGGEQTARESRETAGNDEGAALVRRHVVADERCSLFALTDGLQDRPERRANEAAGQQVRPHDDREEEVVLDDAAVDGEHAERNLERVRVDTDTGETVEHVDTEQAVRAAGEVELEHGVVEQLREREGNHREEHP
ncbi:hypothetical protein HFX_6369 (plasmid) [Haloferax mediterranei ATCC 33500]|uniref:Uncharacterized protein n=1 Tax=Haloferax mediterranei (strain ATCC 33500 / DSM 1411 / JCM 8866 / NBRC 14739 / NCIMB 2177 / R-4) TaxID=523841 RepID=I3RB78_HALMT|nr:hypothetical protein HFX_6369 [Haloferax mediterranei ATCC 33500]